jgi:sulfate adenylyltransferase large subunit
MSALAEPISGGTEEFLRREEEKDLLRFFTAGSVDDGKSTLIGRLLYDSKGVYEDQLISISKSKVNRASKGIDLSLLTDGLRAEREQGITIDVAYRYFSTPRRKFIIADTPGHEQYTRNMATGASTAELAIVLIDARYGVLPQTRRHTYISWLLGTPVLAVAVNKMDIVGYDEAVFTRIRQDFLEFASELDGLRIHFFPISALEGDNVVKRGSNTPWYSGPSLLEFLETVPVEAGTETSPMRFPVQYVIRPNLDFRGFAGQISAGTLRRGQEIVALPSGRTSRVKSITTFDGDLESACAPMSVTVVLEDELDISRGDMLVAPGQLPAVRNSFEASVVWMNSRELETGRSYLLKHTTQTVTARVRNIHYRVEVTTLGESHTTKLGLNDIGVVTVETNRPLFFDPYREQRATGSFILIDPLTNETVGAGMIRRALDASLRGTGRVSSHERHVRNGHSPAIIAVGPRPDVAWNLERELFERGCQVGITERGGIAAEAMARAGLITLVTGECEHAPVGIARLTAHHLTVESILEWLEASGVLSVPELFESGEGI